MKRSPYARRPVCTEGVRRSWQYHVTSALEQEDRQEHFLKGYRRDRGRVYAVARAGRKLRDQEHEVFVYHS